MECGQHSLSVTRECQEKHLVTSTDSLNNTSIHDCQVSKCDSSAKFDVCEVESSSVGGKLILNVHQYETSRRHMLDTYRKRRIVEGETEDSKLGKQCRRLGSSFADSSTKQSLDQGAGSGLLHTTDLLAGEYFIQFASSPHNIVYLHHKRISSATCSQFTKAVTE